MASDPFGRRRWFGGWPEGVEVADGARVARDVKFRVGAGGAVRIGSGAVVEDGCVVAAGPGASVVLDGTLGASSRIHAAVEVRLEAGAVVEEECLLTDTDVEAADPERPVREQGLRAAPVRIGSGARLGRGAAVLGGASVGPGARVTARSVVTSDVPAGADVSGVPVRPGSPAVA